ncbi:MAG: DUF1592 domain-containing protein [Acidobacteria bacterium]|nr:DUF1592 domain-containing protein [Acidobacteriota bacterium]
MKTRNGPLGVRVSGLVTLVWLAGASAQGQTLQADVAPLVETSCLRCHGARTVTPLNLERLGFDLTDHDTFQSWQRVFERVDAGDMPPRGAPRPDATVVKTALASLERALVDANLAARDGQRTPLRRLTRLEYGYTIQDLLHVDEAVGAELATLLPAEADSGGFDTVAVNQSMSPLHVRSYLEAADRALDAALVVGPPPAVQDRRLDYATSKYLASMVDCDFLACGAIMPADGGYVTVSNVASTFMFHSMAEGFGVAYPGRYRVSVDAQRYQADSPVTLTLYRGSRPGAAASLDELIGELDLVGDETGTLTVTPFLRPGDLLAPNLSDHDFPPEDNPDGYFVPEKHVRDYTGEGLVLKSMTIQGPLFETWPPTSTRALLPGIDFDEDGYIQLSKAPAEHLDDIVERFATRAFRRPLHDGELETYTSLAEAPLAEGRPFVEVVRVPLRAILSAPPFLYQAGTPGKLDDHALATRLSYFLWRSMPDDTLRHLANQGRLSEPSVLKQQVDRMLDDEKTQRFVKDFAGQAFRLYELRATSPDPGLYPEYDDRLAVAMERETQLFLAELVAGDHGVGGLVDTDFTFLNRRLAEHYGVPGVEGQQMRKVALPPDSPRGGLLTHASILKITANGTSTSPIPRGNFVLDNLLGRPAPPPPPGVGTIEPDTRGTTTIREQLDAHRASPTCANCHRKIDPPGFALESFDPIGGFRTTYRASGGMTQYGEFTLPAPYTEGPPVDTSGVTPDGDTFTGIDEYKRLLLSREIDQVARHLVSQLLVYATGAEIGFADRDGVERIVTQTADQGYPLRKMIHAVVHSDLFRSN